MCIRELTTLITVADQDSFLKAAIEKARQLSAAEQNVIRVGTSILRPCKRLIDPWAEIDDGSQPFQLRIVPFDDHPAGLDSVLSELGKQIDCFVGPCDSIEWQKQHKILLLDQLSCRIVVPGKHRFAKKKRLCWSDLDGETFMIIRRGNSSVLNQMRDDILENTRKSTLWTHQTSTTPPSSMNASR